MTMCTSFKGIFSCDVVVYQDCLFPLKLLELPQIVSAVKSEVPEVKGAVVLTFEKLRIERLKDLQQLPAKKDKMFLNSIYTDGYTCRVLFCRRVGPSLPVKNIALELEDFNANKVNTHFRPCAVDSGRKDVFVSYNGHNDVRRLSSTEYYGAGGTVQRQKKEQELKKNDGFTRN